jgi:outer membrane scaffolding protein for murein synthesis (MipA/OmpV family)
MFTSTQIGAVTLFALSASKDVLGRPLLVARQNSTSSIGNFGSCSVPQIEFGVGFDNRKETSFEPVDKTSFNHGSAQAIDIITQFICDTLTNSCNADATAKATCATAQTAADGQTAKTGAQADAFNAVFGIKTNFAAVPVVSDQGVTLGVDGSATTAAAAANNAATSAAAAAATAAGATDAADPCPATVTVTVSGAAATGVVSATTAAAVATSAAAASNTTSAASSSAIGNFGSCSVPQIEFGVGFDNRKETSFEPVDKTSFNHGSAQAIDIITQFICDTLTNTCNADATAKATCASAKTAADGQTAKTGAQADAFNAVFGIKTNFAAVPVVSDQGVTLGVDGSSAAAPASATTVAAAPASAITAAVVPDSGVTLGKRATVQAAPASAATA